MSDPVFSADWFSQNIAALTEVLAKFKGQPDIQVLEIGCFEGRGTLWFLNNILTAPSSTIDCIDTFEGSQEHEFFGMKFTSVQDRFELNVGQMNGVNPVLGKSFDILRGFYGCAYEYEIIYVDGSHMATDVLQDLVLSWPLLAHGGVMFCDDYLWPGTDENVLHRPKPAIDAFLSIYAEQLKVVHKGYSVAIEKL